MDRRPKGIMPKPDSNPEGLLEDLNRFFSQPGGPFKEYLEFLNGEGRQPSAFSALDKEMHEWITILNRSVNLGFWVEYLSDRSQQAPGGKKVQDVRKELLLHLHSLQTIKSVIREARRISECQSSGLPVVFPDGWVKSNGQTGEKWQSLAALALSRDPEHTLELPIAVTDGSGDQGMVLRATVSMYQPAGGEQVANGVALHPAATSHWQVGEKFDGSLEVAWRAFSGRHRLDPNTFFLVNVEPWLPTQDKGWMRRPIDGASATGAFMRALYRAYKRKSSDLSVLILYEEGNESRWVGPKIDGVLSHNRMHAPHAMIDTLGVHSSTRETVMGALKGRGIDLRVERLDSAHHVETLPNSLALEWARWLRKWADELDQLAPRGSLQGLKASDVFVRPTLASCHKTNRDFMPAQDQEGLKAHGSRLYAFDWSELRPDERTMRKEGGVRGEHTVILGAPGEGKTCAAKHLNVVKMRELAERLEKGEVEPDSPEAILPLFFPAQELAKAGWAENTGSLVIRTLKDMGVGSELDTKSHRAIEKAVIDGRTLIVIDSLDEVEGTQRSQLIRHVCDLAEKGGSLLLTCRTNHWRTHYSGIPIEFDQVVRLLPMNRPQQEEFASKYLGSHHHGKASAEAFLKSLAGTHGMRQLLQVPLFLTFAAILHQNGKFSAEEEPHRFMADVLEASCEGRVEWAGDVGKRAILKFISLMAWVIFQKRPSANRFEALADWKAAYELCARIMPPTVFSRSSHEIGWVRLLKDLEGLGVIVQAKGEVSIFDQAYSFAHRLELEFLAAHGCAMLTEMSRNAPDAPEWLGSLSDPPSEMRTWSGEKWLSPELQEFLTFLASLVRDPEQLFTSIGRATGNDDTRYGDFFGLKCRLVAGVSNESSIATRLVREWLEVWSQPSKRAVRVFHWQHGRSLLAHKEARRVIQRCLSKLLNGKDHETALEGLGHLGLPALIDGKQVEVADHLMEELCDTFASSEKRVCAAKVLGKIRHVKAWNALLDCLRGGKEAAAEAAEGLGLLAGAELDSDCREKIFWGLRRQLTMHPTPKVREKCARALGCWRMPQAAVELARVLSNPEEDPCVRAVAAEALGKWPAKSGKAGDPEAQYEIIDPEVIRALKMAADHDPTCDPRTKEMASWSLAWLQDIEPPCAEFSSLQYGHDVWHKWFNHFWNAGPSEQQLHMAGQKVIRLQDMMRLWLSGDAQNPDGTWNETFCQQCRTMIETVKIRVEDLLEDPMKSAKLGDDQLRVLSYISWHLNRR